MNGISNSNFGLLIAYALPGFIVIWGLSGIWPPVAGCVSDGGSCATVPSLVGFLKSTVAAIAAGMAVSAIRFVVIDTIHSRTGLKRPRPNGTALHDNLAAVNTVIDHHYRYYQFHANMLVAGAIAYGAHLYDTHTLVGGPIVLLALLGVVFWIASRDNLRKYYATLETIFNPDSKGPKTMSNGMSKDRHHLKAQPKDAKVTKQTAATVGAHQDKTAASNTPKKQ